MGTVSPRTLDKGHVLDSWNKENIPGFHSKCAELELNGDEGFSLGSWNTMTKSPLTVEYSCGDDS